MNPSDSKIVHYFGDWQGATHLGISANNLEDFNKMFATKIIEATARVELYDGARVLLDHLSSRAKLAVLTSAKREYIELALVKH